MMMRHMLGSLRQNLQNIKKSPKVADESMFTRGGNSNNNNNNEVVNENEFPIYGNEIERRSTSSWKGFSIIYGFVMAPFSAFTCFSQPHVVNGSDGLVWASAEFSHMSEINHLMVRIDSIDIFISKPCFSKTPFTSYHIDDSLQF